MNGQNLLSPQNDKDKNINFDDKNLVKISRSKLGYFSAITLPLILAACGAQGEGASPMQLSRLFFVLGHVALKMLVRTEQLEADVKKLRAARKKAKEESAKDAMDDELDAAAEEDAEAEEKAQQIADNDLVRNNLLGAFGPMIQKVVADKDGHFSDPLLRRSAAMALSKFMAISPTFCEDNLKLLFTVLLQASDAALRANAIVALGDLAFRFPNSIEPWTDKLYAPLGDTDLGVRRTALQVLSHLILNDMVKVKGKISDICVCLEDDDSRIKGLASLFFDELSKRHSNPIYNLLPDIISSLSRAESVSPQCFQGIMQFLMSPKFVQKENHIFQKTQRSSRICYKHGNPRVSCATLVLARARSIPGTNENIPNPYIQYAASKCVV